jgi:hypothetical protein
LLVFLVYRQKLFTTDTESHDVAGGHGATEHSEVDQRVACDSGGRSSIGARAGAVENGAFTGNINCGASDGEGIDMEVAQPIGAACAKPALHERFTYVAGTRIEGQFKDRPARNRGHKRIDV